ncbi:MAG: hypothetical protein P4L69_03180, partial [Desulfosporosinus sp.]|nr:hypothetical protein [Desulfosporosinus sp.]
MNNGRYKFRAIPLNNIQASAITITATGSTLLEWKIPAKTCFNSARSVLSYTLNFPAQGTTLFPWVFDDTFEIAQSVQMGMASAPGYLVDLQFANNYVSVCRKIDTKATDFENLDYSMALHKSD